nr:hypothetical protein [Tanacetum cinerariifolium]
MEDQPLPADASPTALSPGYVVDSNPEKDEKDPKEDPAYYLADKGKDDDDESSNDDDNDDDDPKEDPAYYPADRGDNDNDESSNDEKDDDVEKDEVDKEEEEHLAPADPSDVSTDDLVPSS